MLSCHDKQLSDHSGTLSDVFLDQFRPRNPDKCAISVMSHRSSQKCLACSRGTIEQDPLGLRDTQGIKDLGMLDRQLDDLLDLLDLLVESSNHIIGRIRHLLHLHETDQRVNFGGEDLVQDVGVTLESDTGVRHTVFDLYRLVQAHHVLALGVYLHQHLVLAHLLDDLPHVGAGFMQRSDFLP